MIFHHCITVEKALELLGQGKWDWPASPIDQFEILMDHKAAGKEFFSGCNKEDRKGICAGHTEDEMPGTKGILQL